jgi:hypothetical protein
MTGAAAAVYHRQADRAAACEHSEEAAIAACTHLTSDLLMRGTWPVARFTPSSHSSQEKAPVLLPLLTSSSLLKFRLTPIRTVSAAAAPLPASTCSSSSSSRSGQQHVSRHRGRCC